MSIARSRAESVVMHWNQFYHRAGWDRHPGRKLRLRQIGKGFLRERNSPRPVEVVVVVESKQKPKAQKPKAQKPKAQKPKAKRRDVKRVRRMMRRGKGA